MAHLAPTPNSNGKNKSHHRLPQFLPHLTKTTTTKPETHGRVDATFDAVAVTVVFLHRGISDAILDAFG